MWTGGSDDWIERLARERGDLWLEQGGGKDGMFGDDQTQKRPTFPKENRPHSLI
jgi:hypothetical protein